MASRHVLAVAMVFGAISLAACDDEKTHSVGSASLAPSAINVGARFVASLQQVPSKEQLSQLSTIGCPAGPGSSAPVIVVVQGDGTPGLFLSTVTFGMV